MKLHFRLAVTMGRMCSLKRLRLHLLLAFMLSIPCQSGSAKGAGCVDNDWECPQDEYCSQTANRCQPCAKIAIHYCDNLEAVPQFKECYGYCLNLLRRDRDIAINNLKETRLLLQNKTDDAARLQHLLKQKETIPSKDKHPALWLSVGTIIGVIIGASFMFGVLKLFVHREARPPRQALGGDLGEQALPLTAVTEPTAPLGEEGYETASTSSPEATPPSPRAKSCRTPNPVPASTQNDSAPTMAIL